MATTAFPDKENKEGQADNTRSAEGQQAGNFDNPQSGESWNNYATKELSGSGGSVTEDEVKEAFEKEGQSGNSGS